MGFQHVVRAKGVVIKFDRYQGGSKLAGLLRFLKIVCGGSQAFENFWEYETKKVFKIYKSSKSEESATDNEEYFITMAVDEETSCL